MHRIGLYGVGQLLVPSNPRFSVDRNIINEKNDDDDDDEYAQNRSLWSSLTN